MRLTRQTKEAFFQLWMASAGGRIRLAPRVVWAFHLHTINALLRRGWIWRHDLEGEGDNGRIFEYEIRQAGRDAAKELFYPKRSRQLLAERDATVGRSGL